MTKNNYAWSWGVAGALALALVAGSCGGTGGGGGSSGNINNQFILNSSNSGRLTLNVDPTEVDANKSDRIGLVAQLSDSRGVPIRGVEITFTSDIPDLGFIPAGGTAITDGTGRADVIAVAGSTPTSTGAIVGTGAIFAAPPAAFGLAAQVQVTLFDVGFIDGGSLSVVPSSIKLVEPAPGAATFFSLVGGAPPYQLQNEVSGVGAAVLSQHCLPGCTESGGVLCVGTPCRSDGDCNENGSPTPSGVCVGPISRCLASCAGTNCAGSRCASDADCNDGSPTPANVCKDSGQSIVYVVNADGTGGTHTFLARDSAGASVTVTVDVSYICGNGVARGAEQCDLGDLRGATCASLGFTGGTLLCSDGCKFETGGCVVASPGGGGSTPTAGGPTPTGVTPTPTPTAPGGTPTGGTATPTAAPTPGVGVPSNLALALLANGSGDNGNGTLTTVVAATVTDTLGNPVPDDTLVTFSLTAPTGGAVINSPSGTNTDPPCDVTNFEEDTLVSVLNQPGVAHTCITYPTGQAGTQREVNAVAGAASDSQLVTLPLPPL